MSDTKLATFLAEKKLDQRRLVAASHKLETLQLEDRGLKLQRRDGRKEGAEKKEVAKPRSGRPITAPTLAAALSGAVIPGPSKQRILRAVNYLLEQKKQSPVDLRALF